MVHEAAGGRNEKACIKLRHAALIGNMDGAAGDMDFWIKSLIVTLDFLNNPSRQVLSSLDTKDQPFSGDTAKTS